MLRSTIFLMVFTKNFWCVIPKFCGIFFINCYNFGTNWHRMDLKYVLEWALNKFSANIGPKVPDLLLSGSPLWIQTIQTIDLFRYTKNWMTQNTRPTHPWLKLSQISNFLTGVGSPRSEWSEKVKKIIHSTLFGFRIIKTVFKKGPFLWYRPTNLTWFRWFWSLVRACILNFDFFLVILT